MLGSIGLVALALALPAGAATSSGVLRGVVTRGPVTPVCRVGTPCDAPAKRTLIRFTRNGVARSVTTGTDGRYAIRLPAGTWTIAIPGGRFGYRPKAALVRAGAVRTVNIFVDTGIR